MNSLVSTWGLDDIKALADIGTAAILFPSIESESHVHAALKALDSAGAVTCHLWS